MCSESIGSLLGCLELVSDQSSSLFLGNDVSFFYLVSVCTWCVVLVKVFSDILAFLAVGMFIVLQLANKFVPWPILAA